MRGVKPAKKRSIPGFLITILLLGDRAPPAPPFATGVPGNTCPFCWLQDSGPPPSSANTGMAGPDNCRYVQHSCPAWDTNTLRPSTGRTVRRSASQVVRSSFALKADAGTLEHISIAVIDPTIRFFMFPSKRMGRNRCCRAGLGADILAQSQHHARQAPPHRMVHQARAPGLTARRRRAAHAGRRVHPGPRQSARGGCGDDDPSSVCCVQAGGPPTNTSAGLVQNKLGAKFNQKTYTWTNSVSQIFVQGPWTEIDNMVVIYRLSSLDKFVNDQAQARKKAQKNRM